MEYIDLHIHSTASDGLYSPEEIVREAVKKGLKAIAVTDHDSVANVAEAVRIGKEKGLEVIPGIEISVFDREEGFIDVHVLGYFIDINNHEFLDFLRSASEARISQKKLIVARLRELGYNIRFEEIREIANGELGRPHIAQVLMKKHPEEFPDMDSVFTKMLGSGKDAYIERDDKVTLRQAITIIKKAGGIPVLAHPAVYGGIDIDYLISIFIKYGGMGIETYYPYDRFKKYKGVNREELWKIINRFQSICKEHNLLESGGNDCHGTGRVEIGYLEIPYEILEKMKEFKKNL